MSDIEVRHLSKSFDLKGVKVEALKDINLSIKPGDIYGIIGMSGAGKSTLVRCLNFLEKAASGDRNDFPAFQSADAEECD